MFTCKFAAPAFLFQGSPVCEHLQGTPLGRRALEKAGFIYTHIFKLWVTLHLRVATGFPHLIWEHPYVFLLKIYGKGTNTRRKKLNLCEEPKECVGRL